MAPRCCKRSAVICEGDYEKRKVMLLYGAMSDCCRYGLAKVTVYIRHPIEGSFFACCHTLVLVLAGPCGGGGLPHRWRYDICDLGRGISH